MCWLGRPCVKSWRLPCDGGIRAYSQRKEKERKKHIPILFIFPCLFIGYLTIYHLILVFVNRLRQHPITFWVKRVVIYFLSRVVFICIYFEIWTIPQIELKKIKNKLKINKISSTSVLPMRILCVSSPDPVPVGSAASPPRRPVPPFPVPSNMPCSPGCQRPTSAGHNRWTRWTSPWSGRRLPRNGLPRVYLPDKQQEVGSQIDSCLSQWHHVHTWLTSLLAISVVSKTLRFVVSYGCVGGVVQMGRPVKCHWHQLAKAAQTAALSVVSPRLTTAVSAHFQGFFCVFCWN